MKMTRKEFHREIETIIEAPEGSVTSETNLEATGHWDSMDVLSFISLADLKFEAAVDGPTAAKAVTVADLEAMVREHLTDDEVVEKEKG